MGRSRPTTPDVYGRRRSPGLVLGLAAVFVVGAAGIVLGRATAPQPGSRPAPNLPVTSGVPGVGPGGVANGVPVGYAHTPLGAAQAAGNFLATLGGQVDPAKVRAALDEVAESGSRDQLERALASSLQAEEGLWGIQEATRQGQLVVLTQTPIAYRVDSYTPDQATVRVWLVTNVGVASRQRLAAFFGISSATLVWVDGDWRLRATDAGNQAGDVVPACLQTPTPTGGVPALLDGFVPYGS